MALVKLARDNIPVRCSFRHGEADKTITSSFSSDTCRPLSFGRVHIVGEGTTTAYHIITRATLHRRRLVWAKELDTRKIHDALDSPVPVSSYHNR